MTQGCELRALDVMNNSVLWMIGTTLGHELKALNIINNPDAMNNSES